ncbi:hypothetical protein VTK73DRAFT_9796 [Phialemonium thermophilum]|uniref:Protein kinase domain-containing protein n=1 Tax=Phialemonium thermophilum TaxID=223376 RepID=A0ABR3W074_9PEZI
MVDLPAIPKSFAGLPWTHGLSGAVFYVNDDVVVKRPLSEDLCKQQLDVERQIYERLGSHPRIAKLLGTVGDMLILERLQCPLRQRLLDLRSQQQRPTAQQVTRWASQTAEALRHAHSRGVKQVDIGTYNVLLDGDDDAKLSDFAGSSLDGSEPTVAPSAHATHPRLSVTEPSISSELFAFGSFLYEVETTYEPYHDKNDEELEDLFEREAYPDTDRMILGEVIKKCWTAQYTDADEMIADIQSAQRRLQECHYDSGT